MSWQVNLHGRQRKVQFPPKMITTPPKKQKKKPQLPLYHFFYNFPDPTLLGWVPTLIYYIVTYKSISTLNSKDHHMQAAYAKIK